MIQRIKNLRLKQEIGVYSSDIENRFKTSIRSNLCDYSDAYIYVKATTTVSNTEVNGAAVNIANKIMIFKNCAPFTKWNNLLK